MYMRFPGGKPRAVTLSYDDCVVQDIRLIEILNKYGLKATFNLNSGLFLPEDKGRINTHRLKKSEALKLYKDSVHEVASHGVNHLWMEKLYSDDVIAELLYDRKNLEADLKKLIRGMAYPYGTYNDTVIEALKLCKFAYARTTVSTERFALPQNFYTWHPTAHHNNPNLMLLIDNFLNDFRNVPSLFYLWGHSYEFDNDNNWEVIEKFCEKIGGREDIWYATNIEVHDYIMAYRSLITNVDKTIIYNPTALDIWIQINDNTLCVKAGETLNID